MSLHRLTKLVVAVPDVQAAAPFYSDFGLKDLGRGKFATLDGGEQLNLVQRSRRGLVEIGVGCDDEGDLDRVAHGLTAAGIEFERDPIAIVCTDIGSGVRARLSIAERYLQRQTPVPAQNGPGDDVRVNERAPGSVRNNPVRPRKLGHVVVGSTDVEASERLFIDILGFQVSDTIRNAGKFVRCSPDHHNLMISKAPAQFMHHTSWQVDDVDEVGRGAVHMLNIDPTRHAWGLGRHNVGGNFFWYLRDPAGNYAEYYSDLDIITEAIKWEGAEWGGRESVCGWAPPAPKGFFSPDDVAEQMMKADG